MKRATTSEEKNSVTFTIIVDDNVAAYIEQEKILDTNAYMVHLLQEAKRRFDAGNFDLSGFSAATPDTSGYPEMTGHFDGGPIRIDG